MCEGTFISDWTEEERDKEFNENPYFKSTDETCSVCDDCFKEINLWFNSLTLEERKKMRDDYDRIKNE